MSFYQTVRSAICRAVVHPDHRVLVLTFLPSSPQQPAIYPGGAAQCSGLCSVEAVNYGTTVAIRTRLSACVSSICRRVSDA